MGITVYENLNQILTLSNAHKKDGRNLNKDDLSVINEASVVFDQEQILWVGSSQDLPTEYSQCKKINLQGHVLTPELVDSHTHLVFGGNRSKEYTMRLNGADYEAIGKAGGGILSTMNATRNDSLEELYQTACERVKRLHSYGVGTIEIKSGYALDFDREYDICLLINRLKEKFKGSVQIINTFMGAHAIPKEYKSSKEYLEKTVFPLMEKLVNEKLIDACDIFHEQGYFSNEDTEIFFKKCKSLGIPAKSHADEFNDNKGAILATKYNALSTDHLLMTGVDGIQALAQSSTVATLLPGTGFFLGKPQADAQSFLKSGAKVAIASDYNPGSCHCDNVLLLASIAAPHYKMNITQLWSAVTLNAAHALGLTNQGAIIKGLSPRFSLFKTDTLDEITYSWGRNYSVELPS